ncbi:putative nuclease HARBI1 [Salvia splendens]|uniref:putative nuclease HARBI1 n=1 Tax=Salvia splendens TaxID=180675 RepID=UPI001C264EAA|nr:putative nuclease HARBI1 [Salvia splendens]
MTDQDLSVKVTRKDEESTTVLILLEEVLKNLRLNLLLWNPIQLMMHALTQGGNGLRDALGLWMVRVPIADTPRYRNRKGQVTTNTLAVCDRRLRFVYVLPGWEGSAGDSRILRDAISRPFGLKVPKECYYLCDNAYSNSEGFITPYKGVRYHLKEWGPGTRAPQTPQELFNLKHTKARNVIERAFAVLKMRWGILRSPSFYPIDIQTGLIIACFLLHNFIRTNLDVDPCEDSLNTQPDDGYGSDNDEPVAPTINAVLPTALWTKKRDDLAAAMWAERMLG